MTDHLFNATECLSAAAALIAAAKRKKATAKQKAQAKKNQKYTKHYVKVNAQPRKHKGKYIGSVTFQWMTGPKKGKRQAQQVSLGTPAKLSIASKRVKVTPKSGDAYFLGAPKAKAAPKKKAPAKKSKKASPKEAPKNGASKKPSPKKATSTSTSKPKYVPPENDVPPSQQDVGGSEDLKVDIALKKVSPETFGLINQDTNYWGDSFAQFEKEGLTKSDLVFLKRYKAKGGQYVEQPAPVIEDASAVVNNLLKELHQGVQSEAKRAPAFSVKPLKAFSAQNDAEAKEYTNKYSAQWKTWTRSLTKDEVNAVQGYTAVGYLAVNELFRTGKTNLYSGREGLDPKVTGLLRAIKKSSVPTATKVFRGGSNPSLHNMFKAGKLKPGAVYKTEQFYSTSANAQVARSFGKQNMGKGTVVVWDIDVPEGAKAAYVEAISSNKTEYEMIMQPGSALHIKGATLKGSVLHVQAQYIDP